MALRFLKDSGDAAHGGWEADFLGADMQTGLMVLLQHSTLYS